MIKLGQILTMQLFPDVSFFQEVVQPMQFAAPGEYDKAYFEDMPRNKGLWKLVEKTQLSEGSVSGKSNLGWSWTADRLI
jgi:hypothetical protein